MQTIGGTTDITIDGKTFTFKGSGTIMPQTSLNEVEADEGGIQGRTVTPTTPTFKGTFTATTDFDWDKLRNGKDMTVQITSNSGTTYTLSGAIVIGEMTLTTKDNSVEVEFAGDNCTITNA